MASENHIYKMSNAGGFKAITRYPDMLAGNTVWNPWSPVGSFDALATVTLASTAGSIDFTGIPTGYKHLQVRALTRSSEAAGVGGFYMRFNSDTGSNYSWHRLYGDGTSAQAGAGTTTTWMLPGISSTTTNAANMFSTTIVDVLDYASISKNKTIRGLTGKDENGSGYVGLHSGSWYNSSSPITTISILPFSGSWQQYSQFALYGVK